MKITLEIPPELSWLIGYYEKKAEIRSELGKPVSLEFELVTAIEQYAIQGLRKKPVSEPDSADRDILPGT